MKRKIATLVFVAATCVISASASAAVVLEIDPTDTAAVTLTATNAFSEINDSSALSLLGVMFVDIFTDDFDTVAPIDFIGTLSPAGTSETYDRARGTLGTAGGTEQLWLNLYDSALPWEDQVFSTSEPAFTGSATIDLSGASFIANGSTGDIVVGDTSGGSGDVIGQYLIVPEPASVALAGLGVLVVAWRRK